MRRLFPRKFSASYIKTDRFDTNKAAQYNSQRSKATTGSRGETEHRSSSWLEVLPSTPPINTKEELKQLRIREKMDVLDLYRLRVALDHQGVEELHKVSLETKENYQLSLYFSRDEYIFVAEFDSTRMISRPYKGRAVALYYYKRRKIAWNISESK